MFLKRNNQRYIDQLISSYPRQRPALPEALKKIYHSEYHYNRGANGGIINKAVTLLERWMHIKTKSEHMVNTLLEIGAGTLNHYPYEPMAQQYDIVEPFTELFEKELKINADNYATIGKIYKNIMEIKSYHYYNKIVSIATFEHIEDLPATIAKVCLLLKKEGIFQVAIPSEGGGLWYLSWRLTTGLSFYFRTRQNYAHLMHHEHINKAHEILTLIKELFHSVQIKRFPTRFHHFSFYCYIEASQPNYEKLKLLNTTHRWY